VEVLHNTLCPIFQSFLWHSVLPYLVILHLPHSLRVAGKPRSPGLQWQTAHSHKSWVGASATLGATSCRLLLHRSCLGQQAGLLPLPPPQLSAHCPLCPQA
jgi:hypothetical protein